MNRAWLLALGMGLAACAPAQTRAELSDDAPFIPVGQEAAAICTHGPLVGQGGLLIWNEGSGPTSHRAPYLLSCPEFAIKNDGAMLTVQDTTFQRALTHFDPEAYFVSYFADLLVSADPTEGVPEALLDDVRRIRVIASQAGRAETTLLKDAQVTPVRYDPAQPLKLTVRSNEPTPWPEVTIEASKGLIIAPVFK